MAKCADVERINHNENARRKNEKRKEKSEENKTQNVKGKYPGTRNKEVPL